MGSKGHARTLRKQAAKSGPKGRKGLAQARDHRKGKRDPKTGVRVKPPKKLPPGRNKAGEKT